MTADGFKQYGQRFGGQMRDIATGLREKGFKHFARAAGVSAAVVVAAHALVLKPGGAKLRKVESDLVGARATDQHAAKYLELEGRLNAFYSTLPPDENTENWLSNAVIEALRAEDVFVTQINPVDSQPYGGFKLLSVSVSGRAKFDQIGRMVARIEASPKLLHIAVFHLEKDTTEPGTNIVKLKVTTVVPEAFR